MIHTAAAGHSLAFINRQSLALMMCTDLCEALLIRLSPPPGMILSRNCACKLLEQGKECRETWYVLQEPVVEGPEIAPFTRLQRHNKHILLRVWIRSPDFNSK